MHSTLKNCSAKVRQSNFELLRIVAMLFIIAHHFVLYGETPDSTSTINHLVYTVMYMGGKFGVNCFILISGYFMVYSKFSSKKILKLVFEVLFFSVGVFLVICLFNPSEYFTRKNLIDSLLLFKANWFFTAYFILMLLSPVLNLIIEKLSKTSQQRLLIVFFVVFSVLGTFPYLGNTYVNQANWFAYMYFLGAYIRKYSIPFLDKKRNAGMLLFVFYTLGCIFQICIEKFGWKDDDFEIRDDHSLFLFLASLGLFMLFKNLNIGSLKAVNLLASGTFAVYLIHDNHLMEDILWKDMLNVKSLYGSAAFPVYAFLIVIAIFVICTLIDLLRQNLLERPIFKLKFINNICSKMDNWYKIN